MTAIWELADRYVEAEAELDPCYATLRGLSAGQTEMTDYSPDGIAGREDRIQSTLAELERLQPENEDDRLAKVVMAERLGSGLELSRSGEDLRALRVIFGPGAASSAGLRPDAQGDRGRLGGDRHLTRPRPRDAAGPPHQPRRRPLA